MYITELSMEFEERVRTRISAKCLTPQDCDELIAWLQLAKANMKQWEKIHAKSITDAESAAKPR